MPITVFYAPFGIAREPLNLKKKKKKPTIFVQSSQLLAQLIFRQSCTKINQINFLYSQHANKFDREGEFHHILKMHIWIHKLI